MSGNNINPNTQYPQFLALSQAQLAAQQNSQQQVAMQAVNPELLNQTVQDSYVSNRVKASQDTNPLVTLGVGSALWYGIAQGMDKFNPKCEGEYSKTILGKVGGWGDRFTKKTWVGKKLDQFAGWVSRGFDRLAGKSKIAYSLRHHSTSPEWSFAKTPGAGLHGFLAADTEQIFDEFMKPFSNPQKFEQLGVSQEAIDTLKNSIKGKTKAEAALILRREELKLLGAKPEVISKLEAKKGIEGLTKLAENLKVRKLGFDNMAHYTRLKGKFLDNPDEIMKVLERGSKNNIKVSIWRSGNKVKDHLIGRTCSLSEYLNKYKATLGKGNETRLGKFMAKAFGYLTEGCTNRFAGGKLAVAFQAFIFADMLIHTWKAPKGEKGKTLAERFVNDFTYFIAMAAGIMGMHKIGGFKYAGIDKAGVTRYREALKLFNEKVKAKGFASKAEYKTAKKALKDMLGTKNIKNPITKLLQKIGSFLNIGNERILSYRSTSKNNLNFLRKLANGNIIGVPMRILIPMMIISPFLAKWATKGAHAIFGKPSKSVLDEDKEDENLKAQQVRAAQQIQPPPQLQGNIQQQTNPAMQGSSILLDKHKTGQFPPNVFSKPGEPVRTYIPSPHSNIKSSDPARNYVPSPMGVRLANNEDLSKADAALQRADAIEKQVYETLKMN